MAQNVNNIDRTGDDLFGGRGDRFRRLRNADADLPDGRSSGVKTRHYVPRGFTLIEILLVVAIIGALAAMVVPRLTGRSEKAKVATAKADIRANIATALKMYEIDMGTFPTTEQGLGALLKPPDSASSWNGPYIERMPVDPWGRSYLYKFPGAKNPNGYDLYSFGRDGVESQDDIGDWE